MKTERNLTLQQLKIYNTRSGKMNSRWKREIRRNFASILKNRELTIRLKYREWRKKNGNQIPNRAIVKMAWEDCLNTKKGWQQDTIALKDYGMDVPKDDVEILFYTKGLRGLIGLTRPGNGSDFVVLEVIDFFKYSAVTSK